MSQTALATLAIITFINQWNDYLWPLIVGKDIGSRMLTVALGVFRSQTPNGNPDWGGLMAGTVLVNLAPSNPYSVAALAAWRQGHFLNFNGLTRLAASFWPFLALPYLILLGRRL